MCVTHVWRMESVLQAVVMVGSWERTLASPRGQQPVQRFLRLDGTCADQWDAWNHGGVGVGGGPIDFRIEGVLACVYKVVMSAVMSQIRWFWAVEKPDTGKALYCRNTEAVTPKFKLETVDWLCSYEQQNCNNWWFRVLLINNYN